ncbi:MAG TPA: hypothetical protein VFW98_11220 [Gemmatimonadaceae bacterium]|nr:hypothetical protein [Gemmatimonadaceae bacterium]
MPYLCLYSAELPLERKRELAAKLTDELVATLPHPEVHRARTTIHFVATDASNVAVGGRLASDGGATDLRVDISDRHLTLERRVLLAHDLTKLLAEYFRLPDEERRCIKILFREYGEDDLAVGGHLLSQPHQH